jgi:hypothetical protein
MGRLSGILVALLLLPGIQLQAEAGCGPRSWRIGCAS